MVPFLEKFFVMVEARLCKKRLPLSREKLHQDYISATTPPSKSSKLDLSTVGECKSALKKSSPFEMGCVDYVITTVD